MWKNLSFHLFFHQETCTTSRPSRGALGPLGPLVPAASEAPANLGGVKKRNGPGKWRFEGWEPWSVKWEYIGVGMGGKQTVWGRLVWYCIYMYTYMYHMEIYKNCKLHMTITTHPPYHLKVCLAINFWLCPATLVFLPCHLGDAFIPTWWFIVGKFMLHTSQFRCGRIRWSNRPSEQLYTGRLGCDGSMHSQPNGLKVIGWEGPEMGFLQGEKKRPSPLTSKWQSYGDDGDDGDRAILDLCVDHKWCSSR